MSGTGNRQASLLTVQPANLPFSGLGLGIWGMIGHWGSVIGVSAGSSGVSNVHSALTEVYSWEHLLLLRFPT